MPPPKIFIVPAFRWKHWCWFLNSFVFLKLMLFVEVLPVSRLSGKETVSLLWSCDCPKIRSNKISIMNLGCHQLWDSVAVFPLCALLCKYVRRKPIFVYIWLQLIKPQSTNKSQTHILSCLSCAASPLQCVMLKKRYQLLKGQIGGCFLWADTRCSSSAITEPMITSSTCPPLIDLNQPVNRIKAAVIFTRLLL